MTDLAWTIRHPAIGTLAVCGFVDARRARLHVRNHFLNPRERWEALNPPVSPETFRVRLRAPDQEPHRVLDDAVRPYECAVKACTMPRDSIELAARVLHRPADCPRPVPRILVVSRKGVLVAFQPGDVSDLRSAYRPLPRQFSGVPTPRDYLLEARADFGRAVKRSAQGSYRRPACRR